MNRIVKSLLNKKVLKYVLILSIIAAIAYYFYTNNEGFTTNYSCSLPNGVSGSGGILLGKNNTNLAQTCKSYGVSCPSGFSAGSLNTNIQSLSSLTRCVKNIQMCNDNSDYNEMTNKCRDNNSGQPTPVKPGAVCVKGSDENKFVSGSICQIAKKSIPSCDDPPHLNDPHLTFNTTLQRCVLPCYNRNIVNGYHIGKYPPKAYSCIE